MKFIAPGLPLTKERTSWRETSINEQFLIGFDVVLAISYVLISNFILNLKVMWYETVYCCNFENLNLKTRITSEEKK